MALLGGAIAFGAANMLLGLSMHHKRDLKTRPTTEHTFNKAPEAPPPTPPLTKPSQTPTIPSQTPPPTKPSQTPQPDSQKYGPPKPEGVPEKSRGAGSQQVPNPMGYSSQGDYLGGVVTHSADNSTYAITADRGKLVKVAGISDYYGGDNENLIKLAHASYIAEKNKYNVVFG